MPNSLTYALLHLNYLISDNLSTSWPSQRINSLQPMIRRWMGGSHNQSSQSLVKNIFRVIRSNPLGYFALIAIIFSKLYLKAPALTILT
jgi:hypothetical protein